MTEQRPLRVGVVAGEASGDILAADLIRAIRIHVPNAEFVGIGGSRMEAAGCHSLFPLEKLSVMGLVEVLRHLPELLSIRRQLLAYFLSQPPDIFIGVDAPDFNLPLERRLKAQGISTVHYVSPSVWAWRQYRVKKIARSTDLMLTLFPFEADFYRQHDMAVRFVGHPLAEMIPQYPDSVAAKARLGLSTAPVLALLPGSRRGEVSRLALPFLQAALHCHQRCPSLQFVVPHATAATRAIFTRVMDELGVKLPLTMLDGQSHEAMAAADVVLLASGTASLEALLLQKPMVVAYKLAPLTYWVARRLLRTPYYSLPNQLLGRACVAEVTQQEVTGERLADEVLALLDTDKGRAQVNAFNQVAETLRRNASDEAAVAILAMLEKS